jgi:hypothetical protein
VTAIVALAVLVAALAWALLPREGRVVLVAPTPTPTPALTPTQAPTPAPTVTPVPATTVSTVSVATYGAKGDGVSDDTAAVTAALKANAGKDVGVYFPAGTYRITSIVLPADLTLVGAGAGKTWLEGQLTVAGQSRLYDLQLGAAGQALRFGDGARHTTFASCRLVGGGGMTSGDNEGVIRFGGDRSASFITFTDCEIGANSANGNGVSIVDTGWSGGTYHDLVWQDCHFLGSPRMDFECIQRADGVHPITTGYYDINLVGCVFEPSGAEAISYDSPTSAAGHSTISGCTIKGAGWNSAYPWHQGVEFNGAVGMTFTHNTVYRCAGAMINHQQDGTVSDNVFSDNVFDGTVSYIGTPASSPDIIYFNNVTGATFDDNVVKTNFGSLLIGLVGSSNNSFVGNQVIDTRAQADAQPCVWATTGSSHNLFIADSFTSAVPYGIAVITRGSNENTIMDSTFSQAQGASFAVDHGLVVNLARNTYNP